MLELLFSVPVLITQIEFSNGDHADEYNGNMGIVTDSALTGVGAFNQYANAAVFNTPLVGTQFSFISNAAISGISGDDARVLYISKLMATDHVPEPATLGLLGLALAGGVAGRRKHS